MELERITTLTFDVVGTLIDFETGILEWYRPWLRSHGRRIDDDAVLRALAQAEDGLQRAHPEMPYTAMLPRMHARVAADWGIDSDDSDALDLRDSIRDWPAFPDAVAGLRTLGERYRLVAVTNADRWALDQMSATLGEPFDAGFACDEVGINKPDPRVWRHVIDRLGVDIGEVLHCAQSPYHDLISAREFGLATARIERRHDRPGSGATPAVDDDVVTDLHVRGLAELVDALGLGR